MKRTDTTTKLVSLLLFGALLAYLGIYVVRSLTNNVRMAPAVYISLSENAVSSGIIVRQESLIKSNEKYLSIVSESGHVVSLGETIAVAYSGEDALKRAAEIKELELKKQYISSVLSGAQSAENLSDRDSSIKSAVTSLASSAVRHETENLSSASIALSSLVLDNTEVNTTDVDLNLVSSQLETLKRNALQDTVAITADSSGLFSASPDGYEYISPEMLSSLDPDSLSKLEESPEEITDDVRGKLVSAFEWYYAATISEKDAARLKVGGDATLDFGRYCSNLLKAKVISISAPKNEVCVIVLRCTEATSEMLFVRRATAEIVFDAHEGIRVPKEAVLSDDKGPYVFTMTGFQAEKKYIDITWETDEYYLASISEDAAGLRVGNDIILTTKGLFDGKVMNE